MAQEVCLFMAWYLIRWTDVASGIQVLIIDFSCFLLWNSVLNWYMVLENNLQCIFSTFILGLIPAWFSCGYFNLIWSVKTWLESETVEQTAYVIWLTFWGGVFSNNLRCKLKLLYSIRYIKPQQTSPGMFLKVRDTCPSVIVAWADVYVVACTKLKKKKGTFISPLNAFCPTAA